MPEKKRWENHQGEVVDSVNRFDVIECEPCRFKHIVPVPTREELEEVYRHEYYSTEKPLYLERHREDLQWWNLVYGERYDSFEEMLPRERRRILDIGSGPGFFLLRGKERGWQTLGIEPSTQAAAHSRGLGLNIIESFLSPAVAREMGRFDVIHMSEVLEHIPDPAEMVRLAHAMLEPEGLLCIVVPNDYSPFQFALRNACDYKPWWVAPPHHINYFDFQSLSGLLQRCGFEICLREATFPIDLFLLMGDNYVGNDALGRECHARRKRFEQNLDRANLSLVKRSLYKTLAEHGIGREALIIGRAMSQQ